MEALFLKLANLSITASWLVLAVLLIRLVFRKAPKWVYCLLWGLVAFRLICPISIESAFSLIPSAEPLPQDILYTATPKIQSGIGVIDNFVNPVLSSSMASAPGTSVNPTQIWSFVLAWIWVAGATAMLLYELISYLRLRRRVATATLLRENIKQSESVDSPFVLGLFRPVIYLPYSVADKDISYVIAHEKAHIRRKDHWWKPIGFVLLAIYWFNPLLWVAYVLLCRDIEVACDEKVIREMEKEDRRAYSTALLHCSVRHRAIAACPLAFGETGVKGRIEGVMNYKKPAFWIVLLAVAATFIAAICLLTVPKRDTYNIEIIVPAGSEGAFVYADEEISPTRGQIIVNSGDNLGDTEILLKPVEVNQVNAYDQATYLTPGMPTKLDAEKGGWFKIGVNMQNPTDEDLMVTVQLEHVEVRVASETAPDGTHAPYTSDSTELKLPPDNGAATVVFLSSMGCNDKNCTDTSHYHDCPVTCADYDHYHNCALDCSKTEHRHSQTQHQGDHQASVSGVITTAFVSGMGCNDQSCTDASHHHDCPTTCTDYDHYHNCSLGCTETSHHHSGQKVDGDHGERHDDKKVDDDHGERHNDKHH